MDTHSSHPDDLSDLERRLSAWQPASARLDADAMLFAAGRASVRPGPARFAWPALTVCLAGLAIVLGVRLNIERNERLALVQQIQRQSPAPAPVPPLFPAATPMESPTEDEPAPNSFLADRRALETGFDAWPAPEIPESASSRPLPPRPPVFHVWQFDAALEP